MAYEKDQKVLAEAANVVADVKRDAGLSTKTTIRADLLNADVHAFSTEIIDYNSVSAAIIEENEELFALSRCCDPFAPQYLTICKTLTKTIEHLGSVFLTKTSMSILHYDITGLENLTIDALSRMVSFNFRKVHDTLQRKKKESHEFDILLYEQMMIFAKVLRRLEITNSKAAGIRLGLNEPNPHVRGIKNNKNKTNGSANQNGAPLRELPSYPLHYEALNQGAGGRGQGPEASQLPDAGGRGPVNSFEMTEDNMQVPETGLDETTVRCSDASEGSGTQLSEGVEPSQQENTASVPSEEENSEAADKPAENDFDERFAQLPEPVKACVTSIIENPDNLKDYLLCLADENYCRFYREKTDIFREAIAFLDNS